MFGFIGPFHLPLALPLSVFDSYSSAGTDPCAPRTALMLLTAGLYVTVWQLGQKRSARKELERRDELSARGFGGEKEKGADRGFGGDGEGDRDIEDGMA